MSFERKRSSAKTYQSAQKKRAKFAVEDEYDEEDEEEGYHNPNALRDRPRSPVEAKRGSEIMRILKEQGNPLVEDLKDKKQVNVLWGEYQLLDIIGEGSFGHVFEAKHNRTGKTFAIKKFKNKYQNKKKAFDQREI